MDSFKVGIKKKININLKIPFSYGINQGKLMSGLEEKQKTKTKTDFLISFYLMKLGVSSFFFIIKLWNVVLALSKTQS